MLEFIRGVYRTFVLIAFWILLIAFAIGGGIIGKALSSYQYNRTILGVIIGLIVGFVLDILLFGFIATILNIDDNLEKLKCNSSGINLSDASTETKKCKNCSIRVSIDKFRCPKCGGTDFIN